MPHLTRYLKLGAMLGLLYLAGFTAAHAAHADDEGLGDAPPPPKPPANSLLEPTDAQKKVELEFLHSLEVSLTTGDGSLYDQSIDVPVMIRQACKGLGLTSQEIDSIAAGFAKSFNVGAQIAKAIKAGNGGYKLITVRTVNGQRRALFRMMPGESGLNFHDLVLSKDARNHYRIADMYVYLSGEMMTATLRRTLAPIVAQNKPDSMKLLSPAEKSTVANLPKIQSMFQLRDKGDYAGAWKIYSALPQEVREEKSYLINGIQISTKIGDDEYTTLVKSYGKLYPEDAALDLLSIDIYFAEKKFDKVMEAIDKLEKRVGPDAVLDTYRGNALLEQDKFEEATKFAKQAIELEKSLALPYYTLLIAANRQKKWDDVVTGLAQFEKEVGRPYGNLAPIDLFKEFLTTDQGKKWQADHAK